MDVGAAALLMGGRRGNTPLDLSELLRPAAFLSALRQQIARGARLPVERLQLCCSLSAAALPAARAGQRASPQPLSTPTLVLGNLRIQGAACDEHGLAPVAADAPCFSFAPDLHLTWARVPETPGEKDHTTASAGQTNGAATAELSMSKSCSARVPLYRDVERTAMLAELTLPCPAGSEAHWVQAGVALFLSAHEEC